MSIRRPSTEKPLGEEVFNPLDKTNLAESVKDHLLRRAAVKLPLERFVVAQANILGALKRDLKTIKW